MPDLFYATALLLHHPYSFGATTTALLGLAWVVGEKKRVAFALVALMAAILLGFGLKNLLAKERPCAEAASAVACPQDYSLPSLHSLIAFSVATAFLTSRLFLGYFAFAWLVAYSRIYLGVHTFAEVAAGLALSIFACMLAQYIYRPAFLQPKFGALAPAEDARQFAHFAACMLIAALVWLFGAHTGELVVGTALALGMIFAWLHIFGVGIADFFLALFDRPSPIPGHGAITLFAGALAAITLLPLTDEIVASIFILGAGDAASTLIGRRGKVLLPYNKKKTVEGSVSFVAACLPVVAFGWQALLVAVLAAVAESLQNEDDNLLISLVCVLGFSAF
ncbi:MAG: phosphatase PAP2 family protein [Candidatus Anstonellaceae archaeon]